LLSHIDLDHVMIYFAFCFEGTLMLILFLSKDFDMRLKMALSMSLIMHKCN